MLKTLSVITSARSNAPRCFTNIRSRCSGSLCRKRRSFARERSAPSSWLAWQSWSAKTASRRPNRAGTIPVFAW